MYYGHMSFKIAKNDKIEKQKSYLVSIMSANVKDQWFPKCYLRIPNDPWIDFCNGYFKIYLFLIK